MFQLLKVKSKNAILHPTLLPWELKVLDRVCLNSGADRVLAPVREGATDEIASKDEAGDDYTTPEYFEHLLPAGGNIHQAMDCGGFQEILYNFHFHLETNRNNL